MLTEAGSRRGIPVPYLSTSASSTRCLLCVVVVFDVVAVVVVVDDVAVQQKITFLCFSLYLSQDIYIKFILGKSPHVRHSLASGGSLIKFYTFDEAFPSHVGYVIMCAKDRMRVMFVLFV